MGSFISSSGRVHADSTLSIHLPPLTDRYADRTGLQRRLGSGSERADGLGDSLSRSLGFWLSCRSGDEDLRADFPGRFDPPPPSHFPPPISSPSSALHSTVTQTTSSLSTYLLRLLGDVRSSIPPIPASPDRTPWLARLLLADDLRAFEGQEGRLKVRARP